MLSFQHFGVGFHVVNIAVELVRGFHFPQKYPHNWCLLLFRDEIHKAGVLSL